jgi:plasmid stability protein
MARMIQLRNVPDELHRRLKARAAMAGMSLTDYLLREIREVAERPTREELLRRLEALTPVITKVSPADILREEREKRGRR